MQKSTLTSKGQLTLPKAVRERLGIEPGDTLTFEIEGEDSLRVRIRRHKSLSELKGSLASDRSYESKEAEREAVQDHASDHTSSRIRDGS